MKHKREYRQWIQRRREITVDEQFTDSVMDAIASEPERTRSSGLRRWLAAAVWVAAAVGAVHRFTCVFAFLAAFGSEAQ